MTAILSRLAWAVVATLIVCPGSLDAQTLIPPRLDTSGTVGWFAHDRDVREGQVYDDDTQHRWVFAGDVGWYWTEHLKSEIGISATTTGSSFVLVPIAAPARATTRTPAAVVAVANRGSLPSRSISLATTPGYIRTSAPGSQCCGKPRVSSSTQPPFAPPGLPLPPPAPADTATRVKPVVSAGLKAYISPRAFFRADILISPWTTSRDVTVRAGIGVDLK